MSKGVVDKSMVSVLVLGDKLVSEERFMLHAQSVFESEYVSTGSNDIEKKKATQKFTKRLNAMSKDMDNLHEAKSTLMGVLREFKCAYLIVCNEIGYVYLAKQYASLDYALKEYAKVVKAQKNNPELLELIEPFKFVLEASAFDMMQKDFAYLECVVKERQELSKEKEPEFKPRSSFSSSPDWDEVKEAYKQQLTALKAVK